MMQQKNNKNYLISYLVLEVKQLIKGIKSLRLLKRLIKTPNSDGDQSDTKTQQDLKLKGTIQHLSQLPLKDFINGVCYGSTIPNFEELLLQYYSILNSAHSQEYTRLLSAIKAIQFRAQIIDSVCVCLCVNYHEDLAAILRTEYPFPFSEDSYIQDLENIPKIEANNMHQFNQLKAQFDKLMSNDGKEPTPESKYKGFITKIFDINEHAKYQAISLDSSSTYDFVIALERLEKYIERLEQDEQLKNRK